MLTPAIVLHIHEICHVCSEGMEQASEPCSYPAFTRVTELPTVLLQSEDYTMVVASL